VSLLPDCCRVVVGESGMRENTGEAKLHTHLLIHFCLAQVLPDNAANVTAV
jgi:hypothetical protein